MDLDQLKYPIGKPNFKEEVLHHDVEKWILSIKSFPSNLSMVVSDLSDEQLEWKYRPDGWTIRQVIHHCADSHSVALIRFKRALTEDKPSVMGYEEHLFAQQEDYNMDISCSMDLLNGLHKKWVYLIEAVGMEGLKKSYDHLAMKKEWKLSKVLCLYAWHCEHHLAHVHQALESKGSFN